MQLAIQEGQKADKCLDQLSPSQCSLLEKQNLLHMPLTSIYAGQAYRESPLVPATFEIMLVITKLNNACMILMEAI